jgi:hypothetical protein
VLEVLQGPDGLGSEDPVDSTRVEAEPGQCGLELTDVVAAQVRCDMEEQAVAELP